MTAPSPPRLSCYRLLAQVGAGPDGVSYRAVPPGGDGLVEIRVLAGAKGDAARWAVLLPRLRRAGLLGHSAAVRVVQLALEDDPPFVALDWVDGPTLEEELTGRRPLPVADALTRGRGLCAALQPAHRVGLAHGRLSPATVRLDGPGRPRLDFTGTATRADTPPADQADPADDVAALGAVLAWLLPGQPLDDLVRAMRAANRADRPTLREVDERLAALLAADRSSAAPDLTVFAMAQEGAAAPRPDLSSRERLGRFRLLERLGQGGMGEVYRGEDVSTGQVVAIKVRRPDWAARPDALRRLHKEARLLAEVNNPHVTNLIEVNEDDGIHYLALEFVAGRSLHELLEEGRPLDEPFALAVLADVCSALAEAHRRGIVHRDVKPDNILLVRGTGVPACPEAEEDRRGRLSNEPLAKLSDFGLARHVEESESLRLTRTGAVVGTPLYLSPEQCAGTGQVGPRSDVYGLGATLFHLLAGRPPFQGDGPLQLIAQHSSEPPPDLRKLNPAVSEGVCRVVEKALAKKPEHRHADAGELLRDLRRLLRGEPVGLDLHPRLPACDPANVLSYEFHWDLDAAPERLWPHVSNTERLNRAIGLPAIHYTTVPDEKRGSRRFAQARRLGITAAWQEHPFEWIEARRFGVLREFSAGPFKWLLSVVELAGRSSGGTRLTHTFRLESSGILGRTVAAVEIGVKVRRALDRVYRRIDAALKSHDGAAAGVVDPFEEPASMSRAQRQRLDEGLDRLTARGVDPVLAERLGDFLALAAPQDVARIRPLALARRLGLDADAVVSACLHGAREGLLVLCWDLLCPICRIPAEVKGTLRQLREHGRCEACNVDFALDFANSVELIFRAHPALRDVDLGTYCIGGPAHSPHVAAQVRVAAGEAVELDLALCEGAYRLRGPQLPAAIDFRVRRDATMQRGELDLAAVTAAAGRPWLLHAGHQVLALSNPTAVELLVRVERLASRDDAVTAARASALALFRELFPQEVLSPGQLVSVAALTFVVTDLDGAAGLYERRDEARAFGLINEHLRALEEQVRRHGGALIKAVGEGALAVFSEPAAAVRTLLEMADPHDSAGVRVRAGAHRGPALAATLTDHLDYFGATVKQAVAVPLLVRGGEWVLSQAVMDDPSVAALLRQQVPPLEGEVFQADLPGQAGAVLHRFHRL
jgi:serine/threonine protein kinase/class 3 adenylate cyclase